MVWPHIWAIWAVGLATSPIEFRLPDGRCVSQSVVRVSRESDSGVRDEDGGRAAIPSDYVHTGRRDDGGRRRFVPLDERP